MSNLIGDLETLVLARLNAQTWTKDDEATAVALTVYKQSDPKLADSVGASLSGLGLAAVLRTPNMTPVEGKVNRFDVVVHVFEDTPDTVDIGGSGGRASEICLQMRAYLEDWAAGDIWRPITIVEPGIERIEDDGITVGWTLSGYTETITYIS